MVLILLHCTAWKDKQAPDYFGKGEISAIFKNKGSALDPTKYRGITLSSILTKILVNIILERSLEFYDKTLNEGQMGFRPGRGCTDGIYCLKRIHQWARKQQIEIYRCCNKNSTSFKYLGAYTEFNNSSTGDIELGNRITSGTCKFFELKPFFTNFKIKLHIRVQYFESLVRSRLMYGCQCWVLTKAQINRLESQYIQLFRPGFMRCAIALPRLHTHLHSFRRVTKHASECFYHLWKTRLGNYLVLKGNSGQNYFFCV